MGEGVLLGGCFQPGKGCLPKWDAGSRERPASTSVPFPDGWGVGCKRQKKKGVRTPV